MLIGLIFSQMSIFTSDEPPTKKFKERGSKWGVVPAKEKNPMVDDFGEDIVDENAADNDTKKVIAQFASLEGDLAVTACKNIPTDF